MAPIGASRETTAAIASAADRAATSSTFSPRQAANPALLATTTGAFVALIVPSVILSARGAGARSADGAAPPGAEALAADRLAVVASGARVGVAQASSPAPS